MEGFARFAVMALFCIVSSAIGFGLTLFNKALETSSQPDRATDQNAPAVLYAGQSTHHVANPALSLAPGEYPATHAHPMQQWGRPYDNSTSYPVQTAAHPAPAGYQHSPPVYSSSQAGSQHPHQHAQGHPPQYDGMQGAPHHSAPPLNRQSGPSPQIIYIDTQTGQPVTPQQIQQAQYVPVTPLMSAGVGRADLDLATIQTPIPALGFVQDGKFRWENLKAARKVYFVGPFQPTTLKLMPPLKKGTVFTLAHVHDPVKKITMTVGENGEFTESNPDSLSIHGPAVLKIDEDKILDFIVLTPPVKDTAGTPGNTIDVTGYAGSPGALLKEVNNPDAITMFASEFRLRLKMIKPRNLGNFQVHFLVTQAGSGPNLVLGEADAHNGYFREHDNGIVEAEYRISIPGSLNLQTPGFGLTPVAVGDNYYHAGRTIAVLRAAPKQQSIGTIVEHVSMKSAAGVPLASDNGVYYTSERDLIVTLQNDPAPPTDAWIRISQSGSGDSPATALLVQGKQTIAMSLPERVGPYTLAVEIFQGDLRIASLDSLRIQYLNDGPRVLTVDPANFANGTGTNSIRVVFDPSSPVDLTSAREMKSYSLVKKGSAASPGGGITDAKILPPGNEVEVFADVTAPELYTFRVYANTDPATAEGIKDRAGNPLKVASGEGFESIDIVKPVGDGLPSEQRGISGRTAPYTTYNEYGPPRENPQGFNPADKVITRVARLYYFKDAHRVAQILNRKTASYNRQGVDMLQQSADAASGQFDRAVLDRKRLEREAIDQAKRARAEEERLQQLDHQLLRARNASRNLTEERDRLRKSISDQQVQIDELEAKLADETIPKEEADLKALIAKQKRHRQTLETERNDTNRNLTDTEIRITELETLVRTQISTVTSLRETETQVRNIWTEAEAKEDIAARESFQRTVLAKTADPDTHAIGKPDSDDPVEQVSISVIGEGLIHLRGPAKGVNMIRTMINQIDAPVGQVDVALHTIQINGERADRMEKVAARMEQYLDHSRYLTTRSAQMLRNSVVSVASERAFQAFGDAPALDELMRQQKYQNVFFGAEFIQELREMDSEFLKYGNKILSLHSMDTTSLNSSLFLLALAKNDVREEILARFLNQVQCQLPANELMQFEQSGIDFKFGSQKFQFLACNTHFTSLQGFFDAHVEGPDTLNPLQREFIRLAQIYKARLINEMELKQRVMERSLIEERIGNYQAELIAAKNEEDAAIALVKKAKFDRSQSIRELSGDFVSAFGKIRSAASVTGSLDITASTFEYLSESSTKDELTRGLDIPIEKVLKLPADIQRLLGQDYRIILTIPKGPKMMIARRPDSLLKQYTMELEPVDISSGSDLLVAWESYSEAMKKKFDHDYNLYLSRMAEVSKYRYTNQYAEIYEDELEYLNKLKKFVKDHADGKHLNPWAWAVVAIGIENTQKLSAARNRVIDEYLALYIDILLELSTRVDSIGVGSENSMLSIQKSYSEYQSLKSEALSWILDEEVKTQILSSLVAVDEGFLELIGSEIAVNIQISNFQNSRRPLDHKKFLDLLVDDAEERHIDLIEGTRAHIANIDNYLKRLSVALQDDFDSQFYEPAFREVRETSRFWDVQFSQIETTSILANNREFAIVSPKASMEFDLPKRKILINEAFESALAAYNDYGALVADPNFLALAKLYGGAPVGSTYGGEFPAPLVQDLYPGLPGVRDASFTSQPGGATPRVGANLEALIPDPAIYKFETGTAFEIRPVIHPDGQAVSFHLNYMYTTDIREPVRADEKHLGRIKRHFIDTEVQSENYELRKVSRYTVALKAARTARGVPLLEDVPVAGWLFRPLPQAESSLQQNLIMSQTVIFPTVFDLMGLRWAPAVVDVNDESLKIREFGIRGRERFIENEVFDVSSENVDEALRIPPAERRPDLYRPQISIPETHPQGYNGPGLNIQKGYLQEIPVPPILPQTHSQRIEIQPPPFEEAEERAFEAGEILRASYFAPDESSESNDTNPSLYPQTHELEVEQPPRPGVFKRIYRFVKPNSQSKKSSFSAVKKISNEKPRRSRLAELFRLNQ